MPSGAGSSGSRFSGRSKQNFQNSVPSSARRPSSEELNTVAISFRIIRPPWSGGERGLQLAERLEPALLAGGRQMLGEPLADLQSRPSTRLIVELDSHPRFERLEALGQVAGDVHGAIEELAVFDLSKVEADVDPNAGIGCEDLRPSLVAPRADVELDLVAWQ